MQDMVKQPIRWETETDGMRIQDSVQARIEGVVARNLAPTVLFEVKDI